jgi:hypothetical protein
MYFSGLIFQSNSDLKPPLGFQEISWTKKTLGSLVDTNLEPPRWTKAYELTKKM